MNTIAIKPASRLSWKVKSLYTTAAVAAAVLLPQLFHAAGALSGAGTAPGEAFLPMQLPVILVGLLAGAVPGAVAGLFAPLVSFALSGMPTATMLPFLMIELCTYGLIAGLLAEKKMLTLSKLLLVQLAGRAARLGAVLFAVYAFGYTALGVSSVLMSVKTGLPGILLQWVLLPLLVYRMKRDSDCA